VAFVRAESLVVDFPIYGAQSRSLKKTIMRAATGGTLAQGAGDRVVIRALDRVSFDLRTAIASR
jgi:lipopolysaccharide transport system ATP-binding protein